MQFQCPRCRTSLVLPEQARQYGGSVLCPRCSNNILIAAPVATPRAAARPPQPPTDPRPWVLLGIVLVLLYVTNHAPPVGISVGLALIVWSVLSLTRGLKSLPSLFYPRSKRPAVAMIATLVFSAMLTSGAAGLLIKQVWKADEERQQQHEAQQRRAAAEAAIDHTLGDLAATGQSAAAARNAHAVKLRAEAAQNAAAFNRRLDQIQALMARSAWTDALTELDTLVPDIDAYKSLSPMPPEYQAVLARHDAMRTRAVPVAELMARLTAAKQEAARADRLTTGTKDGETWKLAQTLWQQTLDAVTAIEAADPSARDHPEYDLPALRSSLAAKIKRADKYVLPYERKLAELAALKAFCGDAPEGCGGGWDGACFGAQSAFKQIAHDPRSVDVEDCSQPVLTKKRCWVSECTVRAKNAFGARVLDQYKFSFSRVGIEIYQ